MAIFVLPLEQLSRFKFSVLSAMLAFRSGLESMDSLTWSKGPTNVGQMYVGEESVYNETHWLLNGVRAGFCVQACVAPVGLEVAFGGIGVTGAKTP